MKTTNLTILRLFALCLSLADAWVVLPTTTTTAATTRTSSSYTKLRMAEGAEKFAKQVTGEELEMMLTEWDRPLVIDAYATW